jgi:hypothetical protein
MFWREHAMTYEAEWICLLHSWSRPGSNKTGAGGILIGHITCWPELAYWPASTCGLGSGGGRCLHLWGRRHGLGNGDGLVGWRCSGEQAAAEQTSVKHTEDQAANRAGAFGRLGRATEEHRHRGQSGQALLPPGWDLAANLQGHPQLEGSLARLLWVHPTMGAGSCMTCFPGLST